MKYTVKNYFNYHSEIFKKIDVSAIDKISEIIEKKFLSEKKIFTCGNGGSAYNASHYITDWNKFINLKLKKKFKGFCLNDNIGLVTAYSNDISYDKIFSEQLKNLMDKDDLLICISGSGNSKNIINAVEYANNLGADTIGIVGFDGGKLKKMSNYCVHVPSNDMQICEDIHLMIGHMIMKKITDCEIF